LTKNKSAVLPKSHSLMMASSLKMGNANLLWDETWSFIKLTKSATITQTVWMALCFFKRTKLYPVDPDHDTVLVPFQLCWRWDVNSVLVCSLVKIYWHHWWKSPLVNFALQERKVLSSGETNRLGKIIENFF